MNKLERMSNKELEELKKKHIDKYYNYSEKLGIEGKKLELINDEKVKRLLKKLGWKNDANQDDSEEVEIE